MTTSTETTAELLSEVLANLADVLEAIGPEQLGDPTPCTDYDVEQLRTHVLGWLYTFAAGFADANGQAPGGLGGYAVPPDAGAEARRAADQLIGAIKAGAAQRPLRLGDSAMPGELALGMILWEYQVHGWDLARATGQAWTVPTEAAAESLSFAPAMLNDDYQGEGKAFAPRVAVPDNAPTFDRLLGLSGRHPGWNPA
jgi:uncharacterized protein (TIGR03086 family)